MNIGPLTDAFADLLIVNNHINHVMSFLKPGQGTPDQAYKIGCEIKGDVGLAIIAYSEAYRVYNNAKMFPTLSDNFKISFTIEVDRAVEAFKRCGVIVEEGSY